MRFLPLLVAGIATGLTLAALPEHRSADSAPASAESSAGSVPARVAPRGCEPFAPVLVTLRPGAASSSGVARVEYTVEPRIEVVDMWTEVHLPAGGLVLGASGIARGAAVRGEQRSGAVSARLPLASAGYGSLEVEAVILFVDPENPDQLERASTVVSASWGEPDLGLEQLVVDGEVSNVVPSIQLPRSGR